MGLTTIALAGSLLAVSPADACPADVPPPVSGRTLTVGLAGSTRPSRLRPMRRIPATTSRSRPGRKRAA